MLAALTLCLLSVYSNTHNHSSKCLRGNDKRNNLNDRNISRDPNLPENAGDAMNPRNNESNSAKSYHKNIETKQHKHAHTKSDLTKNINSVVDSKPAIDTQTNTQAVKDDTYANEVTSSAQNKKRKIKFHEYHLTNSEYSFIDKKSSDNFNEVLNMLKRRHFTASHDVKDILQRDMQALIAKVNYMIDGKNKDIVAKLGTVYDKDVKSLIASADKTKEKLIKLLKTKLEQTSFSGDTKEQEYIVEKTYETLKEQITFTFNVFKSNLDEVSAVNTNIVKDLLLELIENRSKIIKDSSLLPSINEKPLHEFIAALEAKISELSGETLELVNWAIDNITESFVENLDSEEEMQIIKEMIADILTSFWQGILNIFQNKYVVLDRVVKQMTIECFSRIETEIAKRTRNMKTKMDDMLYASKQEQLHQIKKNVEETHDNIVTNSLRDISFN